MKYRAVTECPFCGSNGPWDIATQPISPEEAEVYERDENRYSFCHCGGHFQNPVLTDATIEEFYRGTYRTIHPDLFQADKRAERIFPHLPRRIGSMLDVGCAAGALMRLAKESGWRVAGVEPNENSKKQAEQFGSVYRDLAEVDKAFDLVSAVHVLEHVSDPLMFLRQLVALARPGGEILIVVPYYNYRPPHLLAMGGKQICSLFGRLGIDDVEVIIYDPGNKQLRPDDECAELPIVRAKTYMDVIAKARV